MGRRLPVMLRFGGLCLAIASVLFVVVAVLRAYAEISLSQSITDPSMPLDLAVASFSTLWFSSQVLLLVAFIILPIGLLALYERVREAIGPEWGPPLVLVLTWLGVGLILPVAGTDAFALSTIPAAAIHDGTVYLQANALAQETANLFSRLGMSLLGTGAVSFSIAIWKSKLPKLGAILFGAGFAMFAFEFVPAFPEIQAVLGSFAIGAGGIWLAVAILRSSSRKEFGH